MASDAARGGVPDVLVELELRAAPAAGRRGSSRRAPARSTRPCTGEKWIGQRRGERALGDHALSPSRSRRGRRATNLSSSVGAQVVEVLPAVVRRLARARALDVDDPPHARVDRARCRARRRSRAAPRSRRRRARVISGRHAGLEQRLAAGDLDQRAAERGDRARRSRRASASRPRRRRTRCRTRRSAGGSRSGARGRRAGRRGRLALDRVEDLVDLAAVGEIVTALAGADVSAAAASLASSGRPTARRSRRRCRSPRPRRGARDAPVGSRRADLVEDVLREQLGGGVALGRTAAISLITAWSNGPTTSSTIALRSAKSITMPSASSALGRDVHPHPVVVAVQVLAAAAVAADGCAAAKRKSLKTVNMAHRPAYGRRIQRSAGSAPAASDVASVGGRPSSRPRGCPAELGRARASSKPQWRARSAICASGIGGRRPREALEAATATRTRRRATAAEQLAARRAERRRARDAVARARAPSTPRRPAGSRARRGALDHPHDAVDEVVEEDPARPRGRRRRAPGSGPSVELRRSALAPLLLARRAVDQARVDGVDREPARRPARGSPARRRAWWRCSGVGNGRRTAASSSFAGAAVRRAAAEAGHRGDREEARHPELAGERGDVLASRRRWPPPSGPAGRRDRARRRRGPPSRRPTSPPASRRGRSMSPRKVATPGSRSGSR